MRHGAGRVLGYAVLASVLVHALVLFALPAPRELRALVPPEPEPLIARVERVAPPPAPVPQAHAPAPPPATPVAQPGPAQAPAPKPVAIARAPALAPAIAEPVPAPARLPRIDPGVLASVAPPTPAVDEGALERYRQAVTLAAARFKRYPRVAIDNNWEGEVVVLMAIGADGRIASLRVKRGSSYEVLDRQALQIFENAKPFVPVPPTLRGQAFELELRAIYSLRDRRPE